MFLISSNGRWLTIKLSIGIYKTTVSVMVDMVYQFLFRSYTVVVSSSGQSKSTRVWCNILKSLHFCCTSLISNMSENRPPDDNHGDRPAAQRSQSMPDLNTTEEAQFNLPDFIVDELFLPDDYSLWGLESAPVSEAGSVEPTYSTGLRTPTTHYLDFTTEHANHPVNDDAIDTIPSQIPGIGNPLSSEPQSIQHQHISQAGGTSSRDSGVNVAPSPQFNVPTVTAQSRERVRLLCIS